MRGHAHFRTNIRALCLLLPRVYRAGVLSHFFSLTVFLLCCGSVLARFSGKKLSHAQVLRRVGTSLRSRGVSHLGKSATSPCARSPVSLAVTVVETLVLLSMRPDRFLCGALLCLASSLASSSLQQPPFTCSPTNDGAACSALGQLYYATNGPTSWVEADGWAEAAVGTPTNYCTFFGILCAGQADILINEWNDYAHTTSSSSTTFSHGLFPDGTLISLYGRRNHDDDL